MTLSRAGFNRDSTYAVIETGVVCGGLCGDGHLWVLRRNAGHEWSVLWEDLLWVS